MIKQHFTNWTGNDLCAGALAILAFVLPFSLVIVPYVIGLAAVSILFQSDLKAKIFRAIRSPFLLLPACFYIFHLVGLFYTRNLDRGWFDVQVKVSLLLIPLIVFIAKDTIALKYRFILGSFILGNLLSAVSCLVIAWIHSTTSGSFIPFETDYEGKNNLVNILFSGYSYFNYTKLSAFIHVNYYALFVLFILYYLYNELRIKGMRMSRKERRLKSSMALFFLLFFVLLQSRSGFLSLMVLIGLEFVLQMKHPKHARVKLGVLISFAVVLILVVGSSERVSRLYRGEALPSYTELEQVEIRLKLWEMAIPVIKNNPLFGVGTGDVEEAFRKDFTPSLLEQSNGVYLNVHNEYLHTAMRLGIPACLFLLIMLFYPLHYMLTRSEHRYVLGFILIIAVSLIFESMLNRLYGVVFFSLFYSLFGVILTNHHKIN